MEITVFLLRSQICQSESLCQTDPIFGKINGKIRSDTQKRTYLKSKLTNQSKPE